MRTVLFASVSVLVLVVLWTAVQIFIIFNNAAKKSYDMKPFVRIIPGARLRFLFLGDSTAVGIGALDNAHSVAGYFGRDFPDAWIDNDSYNGRKLGQLAAEFPVDIRPLYDLVVLQIGANDIMKFTPYGTIDREVTDVITKARKIGRHVVILHSGNVGLAPDFIWPFDWIMTQRSRAVRRIYQKRAAQLGALYVDLFTQRDNDLFLKDIPRYYCPDLLHPSGDGYKWWYDKIRATLIEAGINLR